MHDLLSFLTLLAITWSILALLYQWYVVWGGGRRDYSRQSGRPLTGMLYNFTVAMLPSHKETVRLHPLKFLAGVVMHIGGFTAIASTLGLLLVRDFSPGVSRAAAAVLIPGLIASAYLLIRRSVTPLLKRLSTPDDYFAVAATTLYIVLALMLHTGLAGRTVFLCYSIVLFTYFPLGKLRHALFFFVARADYGRRLGYRGLYPVPHHRDKGNQPS